MKKIIYAITIGFAAFTTASQTTLARSKDIWSGTWSYPGHASSATLTIQKKPGNKIAFDIVAFSGTHEGGISGVAAVTGKKAVFADKKALRRQSGGCRMIFTHKGNSIQVIQTEGCMNYGGVGVAFDYLYKKGESTESNATFVSLGILPNAASEKRFRELVGEDYRAFLSNMQLIIEDEVKDSFKAKSMSGFIRGMGTINEAIIMHDTNGAFWAAVIIVDNDKATVNYYSNVAEWTDKLPITIEEWAVHLREAHPNLALVFKNKK